MFSSILIIDFFFPMLKKSITIIIRLISNQNNRLPVSAVSPRTNQSPAGSGTVCVVTTTTTQTIVFFVCFSLIKQVFVFCQQLLLVNQWTTTDEDHDDNSQIHTYIHVDSVYFWPSSVDFSIDWFLFIHLFRLPLNSFVSLSLVADVLFHHRGLVLAVIVVAVQDLTTAFDHFLDGWIGFLHAVLHLEWTLYRPAAEGTHTHRRWGVMWWKTRGWFLFDRFVISSAAGAAFIIKSVEKSIVKKPRSKNRK